MIVDLDSVVSFREVDYSGTVSWIMSAMDGLSYQLTESAYKRALIAWKAK